MNALRLPFVIALLACFATQAARAEKPALPTDSLLQPLAPIISTLPITQAPYLTTGKPANFEGRPAKPMRWLAQTVSQGGTHGRDCVKRTAQLPMASYEDAGVRRVDVPPEDRLKSLRRGLPKLQGEVYGFDASGSRTAVLTLNADILNITIHHNDACMQEQYATGTPADKAEAARMVRTSKAVQTLFQNDAVKLTETFETKGLNKTVVFSNAPGDLPLMPQAQPAPKEIQTQLNARLRAKLARDLAQIGVANQKQHLDNEKHKGAAIPWVDLLPPTIEAVFVPCPAMQYAISKQKLQNIRMLYVLDCGAALGFYEQLDNGELSLVKVKGEGPFNNGLANFNLSTWTEPYANAKFNKMAYLMGTLHNSRPPYVQFKGIYDLMPAQAEPVAQIYLSMSAHHESPFPLAGFVPGAKPGDAWSQRKQSWPEHWTE